MPNNDGPSVNPAIVPLAVLCAGLVIGGIAAVFLTRRIARARMLVEVQLAAEAAREADIGEKPTLVDVYVGSLPELFPADADRIPWPKLLPIAAKQSETLSSPHPHHTIEERPGYMQRAVVDGNVLEVSVGIVMPMAPLPGGASAGAASLEALDYCIGTTDTVVCSLLGARSRLIGIN